MSDNDKKEFNHPAYVNVPYFVLQDSRLDFFNKFLFAFFWSFSVSGKRIKASNEYLATLFRVSDKYIQARIKELEDLGFIKRSMIRYKRVIEVLYVPYDDIELTPERPNLKLLPTTVGASTKIELAPTTVGVSHQPQLVPAPTTVGTYNKAISKVDNKTNNPNPLSDDKGNCEEGSLKLTPRQKGTNPRAKGTNPRKVGFTIEQMTMDNPFNIPTNVLEDWLEVRKGKRAQMTSTAWTQANSNLRKLKEAGLEPIDCFLKAVASGWSGIEFRYFKQDIEALTPRPNKFPTADERAANEQKIREREMRAQAEKKAEIEASRDIKSRIYIGASELMKQQEAHRKELGLSVSEYHEQIILGKNKGAVQKDPV